MEKTKIALMTVGFILIAKLSFFMTNGSNESNLSEDIAKNNFIINHREKVESAHMQT